MKSLTRARRYCVSPDCPYHSACGKSINRLRGQEGWARMADLSGVCREYIGWVYEEVNKKNADADGNENRPAHSILMGGNGMRQPPPLGSRTWKPEEEDYLMEKWGQISVPAIAKKLNRTTNAVKVRAQRLGLGAVLMAGEYVTLNQLLLAVNGGSSSYGYKMKSWVENRGLPVHTKKVNRCSFRVVYIEEFWEWAERYRSFIDFSKMEPLALGEEPDWVAEQRKKDFEAYAIQRKDPWGEDEDSRLKMLLSKHRYSWAEISEMMHRSHGAIARRCRDLGIKDRPVSRELTGKRGTWTSEDFEILADGIRHGDSYAAIGKAVGRSEKCVRSKVYNDYLTENADKVREMLGDGAWGHGAPEMDVRHGFYISRTRHQVRRDLSALATVLPGRRVARRRVGVRVPRRDLGGDHVEPDTAQP